MSVGFKKSAGNAKKSILGIRVDSIIKLLCRVCDYNCGDGGIKERGMQVERSRGQVSREAL